MLIFHLEINEYYLSYHAHEHLGGRQKLLINPKVSNRFQVINGGTQTSQLTVWWYNLGYIIYRYDKEYGMDMFMNLTQQPFETSIFNRYLDRYTWPLSTTSIDAILNVTLLGS